MRHIGIALILFFGIQVLSFSQPDTHEVIIISTNDVHGRIDNFSKMAAYVQDLKKTCKDVFVFNGGDLINGNPVVDEATEKGYPIFDLMNSIPYTISCLGNHEFENGEAVLQQRLLQSTSIYVCANMSVNNASSLKTLSPYHILHTSDGTSMAILGLTANSSNPCIVPNINMESPIKAALQYQRLRDSADIFMALTHIGYKADSLLATQLNGLDLIVGGHSHSELPHGILVNGTLITQAGDKLRFLGKTRLILQNHKIIGKTFEMVEMAALTEVDPLVEAKIKAYNNNKVLQAIAGYAISAFNNKEAIGCLKTDALQSILKLDIAFDHVRNISWSAFPAGNITNGDIYEWDSYDYHTLRYELLPGQIRQLILNSLKTTPDPVLFVAGLTYTIVKNKKDSITGIILENAKGELDEKLHYSVGMNSFIACQFMKGIPAAATDVETSAASALIAYLKLHPRVDYANRKRVFVQFRNL